MYLTVKFDRPMFSRSEVIVRTDKLTNTRTDKQTSSRRWKHSPRSAMLRFQPKTKMPKLKIIIFGAENINETRAEWK